jgi:hypothetical protein
LCKRLEFCRTVCHDKLRRDVERFEYFLNPCQIGTCPASARYRVDEYDDTAFTQNAGSFRAVFVLLLRHFRRQIHLNPISQRLPRACSVISSLEMQIEHTTSGPIRPAAGREANRQFVGPSWLTTGRCWSGLARYRRGPS